MAEQQEHPLNRHLFIADNLNLSRALDNESIDLICIDPKSKDGSNDIQNRAPLCPYHNTRKNNRR